MTISLQEMEDDLNEFKTTRGELYKEIWASSLKKTAENHKLNYGDFRKLVSDNDIPVPTSGYYGHRNAGHSVDNYITPLSGDPDELIILPTHEELLRQSGVDMDLYYENQRKATETRQKKKEAKEAAEKERIDTIKAQMAVRLEETAKKCMKSRMYVEIEKDALSSKKHKKKLWDEKYKKLEEIQCFQEKEFNKIFGGECHLYIRDKSNKKTRFITTDTVPACIRIAFELEDVLVKGQAFLLSGRENDTTLLEKSRASYFLHRKNGNWEYSFRKVIDAVNDILGGY